MNKTRVSILLSILLTAAAQLPAAIIVETETNSTATNNNVGTAQAISAASFTSPSPANVFAVPGSSTTATIQGKGGDDDVDFYSFQTFTPGARLYIDVDNGSASFDNIVALFNAAGTLIAWGDDTNPADPGSANSIDALLGPIVLTTGTYFIAITEFPNYPSAALLFSESALGLGGVSVTGATVGLSAYDFSGVQPATSVGYTIHATIVTPEPSTFGLAGLALIAVAVFRRRLGRDA